MPYDLEINADGNKTPQLTPRNTSPNIAYGDGSSTGTSYVLPPRLQILNSDVDLQATHVIRIVSPLSVSTHALTLEAGNNIVEGPSGQIIAGSLSGSGSQVVLTSASNQIGRLGSFTAAGVFQLGDTVDLNVTGPVTAGADISLVTSGMLTLNGSLSAAGSVNLAATNGGNVIQSAGTITAGALTGLTSQAVLTSAGNQIATLGRFTTTGSFQLVDGSALSVSGPVLAYGDVTLTTSGKLTFAGALTAASSTVTLIASNGAVIAQSAGAITAGTLTGSAASAAFTGTGNQVAALGAFTTTGGFQLVDAGTLQVIGAVKDDTVIALTSSSGNLAIASTLGGTSANAAPTVSLTASNGQISETAGTITASSASFTAQSIMLAGGGVSTTSGLTLTTAGTADVAGPLSGAGALTLAGGGTTYLDRDNTYSGGTMLGSGILDLRTAQAAGSGTLTFPTLTGTATARLTLDMKAQPTDVAFANTIANFGTGSQLDLAGLTNGTVRYVDGTGGNPGTLIVTGYRANSATPLTQTYRFSSPSSTAFTATSDGQGGTLVTLCFAGGTRIRTARGDVPVERLRLGDLATTASGLLRRIAWIGRREIGRDRPLHHDQQPVRIRANAFGPGVPVHDLRLSPGHPVLVGADADGEGGALVPIMCLINGTSIARETVDEVTYWHVELDSHDILLAEDLPAESYLEWGERPFFDEASDHALHNPDFVVPGLASRCRPVAIDGPLVEAERERLSAVFAAELTRHAAWHEPDPYAWLG